MLSRVTTATVSGTRRLATQSTQTGESVSKTVLQKSSDAGTTTTTTTVKSFFAKMPWWQKYGGGVWLGGAVTYAGVRSYNEGKAELLATRKARQMGHRVPDDWEAALKGSRQDPFDTVVGSLFWPVTLARNAVPHLVVAMNPDDSPPSSPPSTGAVVVE